MTYDLRPLTIGELLDRTFSIYRRHFILFVGIAALPNLLMLVFRLTQVFAGSPGVFLALVWLVASMFVYMATTTLAQGASVIAVSQIQLGRETNVAEAFGNIRARLGELLIITLNVGVRITLGLLLLIVPGILLALKYALAIPVAVLEEEGVSRSMERSSDLTAGHRGRIFVIYLLLGVLLTVLSSLWPAIVGLVAGSRSIYLATARIRVVLELGTFVTQSVLTPIMTIAIALVYYDERVRKEAFDLEHMMQQIDGRSPGSPQTT